MTAPPIAHLIPPKTDWDGDTAKIDTLCCHVNARTLIANNPHHYVTNDPGAVTCPEWTKAKGILHRLASVPFRLEEGEEIVPLVDPNDPRPIGVRVREARHRDRAAVVDLLDEIRHELRTANLIAYLDSAVPFKATERNPVIREIQERLGL